MNIKTDRLILEFSEKVGCNAWEIDAESLNPIVEICINNFHDCRAARIIKINGVHTTGIYIIEEAPVGHPTDRSVCW